MTTEDLLYRETGEILAKACDSLREKARQVGSFTRTECLDALDWEFHRQQVLYERSKHLNRYLADGFHKSAVADFMVGGTVIVMVTCVTRLAGYHFESLLRVMHVAQKPVGYYLINSGESEGPQLYRRFLSQYVSLETLER
jgi:hypothetical protein